MATLTLHGINALGQSLWTEIQVTPDANSLVMDAVFPSVMLTAGALRNDEPGAVLHMTAEEAGKDPFGHASFGATVEGGFVDLGADDVRLFGIETKGRPHLELRDRQEKVLFQAP
jgi:hypothetical protein